MVRRIASMVVALVLAGATASVGCARDAEAVTPSDLELVAKLTGRESINRTDSRWGVVATDLGVTWDNGRGQLLMAFGDTYGEGWGGNGGGPADADWRCQVLARSTDRDPSDGVTFDSMVEDTPGHAKQLLDCAKDGNDAGGEVTVIPTAGVSVGGRDYMHFMSVRHWGDPGYWETGYSGLAYSDDDGENWTKAEGSRWPGDSRFAMAAFAKQGKYVYMLGTPSGRHGAAHLARVPQRSVLDVGAYQYWTGKRWVTGDETKAKPVVDAPVGELSVAYNSKLKRWLMVYLDEDRGQIVLRDAEKLTGRWSEAKTLVKSTDYPGLYGGFIYPWAMDGDDLYFLMSRWEPYNVYLMRAKLTP